MAEINPGKSLLIIYHSQSGNTERIAIAIEDGASAVPGVTIIRKKASAATANDLKNCRTLVICSPEYFGYMAGAMKDMFDRTYEEVRDNMFRKPYVVAICAGNDGTGALSSIDRIIAGFRMKKIQDPIICRGSLAADDLSNCRRLGETLAAGIDLGIY